MIDHRLAGVYSSLVLAYLRVSYALSSNRPLLVGASCHKLWRGRWERAGANRSNRFATHVVFATP